MSFKDYFSDVAEAYREFRPRYPAALFEYLAAESPSTQLAWDCATGNGQSATAIAAFFDRVVATDASARQIDSAERRANVEYRVECAEASSLADRSVDLVTVSQALHWFDRARFEAEVNRVAKPDGLLAVWTYALFESTPEIDRVIAELYDGILGGYWTEERKLVADGYADITFRLPEIPVPAFSMEADWSLGQLSGYLSTWSAAKRFEAQTGEDPLDRVASALLEAWGPPETTRRIRWPLSVRAWRIA